MAYFEALKVKDSKGDIVNPAQEDSLTILRSIFRLLKPLGAIVGSQSNRLSVDINNVGTLPTLGTVTTVSTVTTVTGVTAVTTATNLTNLAPGAGTIGGVAGFDMMKALSRTAYNTGVRSNLT